MYQIFDDGLWIRYRNDGGALGSRKLPYACPVAGASRGYTQARLSDGTYQRFSAKTGQPVGRPRKRPYACDVVSAPSAARTATPEELGFSLRARGEYERTDYYPPQSAGEIGNQYRDDVASRLPPGWDLYVQVGMMFVVPDSYLDSDDNTPPRWLMRRVDIDVVCHLPGMQRKGAGNVGVGVIRAVGPDGIYERAKRSDTAFNKPRVFVSSILVRRGSRIPTPAF